MLKFPGMQLVCKLRKGNIPLTLLHTSFKNNVPDKDIVHSIGLCSVIQPY